MASARVTVRNTTPKARGPLIDILENGKVIGTLELGSEKEFNLEPGKSYAIKERARPVEKESKEVKEVEKESEKKS